MLVATIGAVIIISSSGNESGVEVLEPNFIMLEMRKPNPRVCTFL